MQWWDDIWLNEGFATWMQSKPLKAWQPEWHVELKETADNQTAMNLDALRATRRSRRRTPAEINELFDPIAYEKGAAVLRMIESWVGEAAFQKAINVYVGQHKCGNARAEDFWSTVAASTGKPVDKVMPTFVDQPGVPLITVSSTCQAGRGTVTLAQSRYSMDAVAAAPAAAPPGRSRCAWRPAARRRPARCSMLRERKSPSTRARRGRWPTTTAKATTARRWTRPP